MRCLSQHNVLYSQNFKNKIKLITLMAGLGCFLLYSVCAFQLCIFKFRLPIYAYKWCSVRLYPQLFDEGGGGEGACLIFVVYVCLRMLFVCSMLPAYSDRPFLHVLSVFPNCYLHCDGFIYSNWRCPPNRKTTVGFYWGRCWYGVSFIESRCQINS